MDPMATSPIATAADYADAMIAARRAKNWLFLLILLAIIGQVSIFLILRRNPTLMGSTAPSMASTAATTVPAAHSRISVPALLEYLVAATGFAGIALSVVLALVLLLLTTIMLVGRLIGVSRVTSAFIWSLVLIVLLFPWQSLLVSPASAAPPIEGAPPAADFKIPGVLYTWSEVTRPGYGADFDTTRHDTFAILRWSRFIVFPAIALVLVLMIQSKSSRGLRMALGEVEFDVAHGADDDRA
jgi:hypothetical protein